MKNKVILTTALSITLFGSLTSSVVVANDAQTNIINDSKSNEVIETTDLEAQLKETGDPVYYGKLDGTDENGYYVFNIFEDSDYSIDTNFNTKLSPSWDNDDKVIDHLSFSSFRHDDDVEYVHGSEIYSFEIQDTKVLDSFNNSSNMNSSFLNNWYQLTQHNSVGSDYDIIRVNLKYNLSNPSSNPEWITEDQYFWLLLDMGDLYTSKDYRVRLDGEFGEATLYVDNAIEDSFDAGYEFRIPQLNMYVGFENNIYQENMPETIEVNSIEEKYGYYSSESSLNYWDNSISYENAYLDNIIINTNNEIMTWEYDDQEAQDEFDSAIADFLISELGSEYYSTIGDVTANEVALNDGTFNLILRFDYSDYNDHEIVKLSHKEKNNILKDRINSFDTYDINDTYYSIEGSGYDDKGIPVRVFGYNTQIDGFSQFTPTSKKIFISYTIVLTIIFLTLLGLYIFKIYRRKQ